MNQEQKLLEGTPEDHMLDEGFDGQLTEQVDDPDRRAEIASEEADQSQWQQFSPKLERPGHNSMPANQRKF